jgi:ribosomal-protein-alanine N-acetyltransferase
MSEIMIRIASQDDFPVLKKIIDDTPTDWSAAVLSNCFSADYFIWVILDNNQAMGFIVVRVNHDDWEIMQIVIDRKCQRKGLANQLLGHVVIEAQKKQIRKLQLEVRLSNHAAICLYKKVGFDQVGLRKKYYANGEDAVLMDLLIMHYD